MLGSMRNLFKPRTQGTLVGGWIKMIKGSQKLLQNYKKLKLSKSGTSGFGTSDDFFDTPTTLINAPTNPPQYTVDYCCEPRRKSVLLH
ncbi:hypothetical protein LXL04_002427 [Taraxacum kok-saghyz]